MPHLAFTSALKRLFPKLAPLELEGETVAELIHKLDEQHPGLRAYIVDEQGSLRKHVNIFIGEELIRDRIHLSDAVGSGEEVYVMQSLSGG